MIARQFSQLHCPFCLEPFHSLTHRINGRLPAQVSHGILHCECDQFPIVEGVVVLRRGLAASNAEIMLAYREKKEPNPQVFLAELSELRLVPRRVLMLLVVVASWVRSFDVLKWRTRGKGWWQVGMWLLGHLTTSSFLRAVTNYFRQREYRPTYVLLASLLSSLTKAKTIVEIGGGAGQLMRALAATGWSGQVWAVEKNFWLTYWVATCGQWPVTVCPIVVDIETVVPLNSGIADAVLANDTLMYVEHQRQLASEIKRLLKPSGWFAGMHIHTAGQENVANGWGLKPKVWLEWLKLPKAMILDDQKLFSKLWTDKEVAFKLIKSTTAVAHKIGNSFSCIAALKPRRFVLSQQVPYAKKKLNYSEDQW